MSDLSLSKELIKILRVSSGTQNYYRINSKTVLTDGTHYLTYILGLYWLMSYFSLRLLKLDISVNTFTTLKLTKIRFGALLTIDDGDGNLIDKQKIEYTDFPSENIILYGVWSGEFWVLMLPSEY